MLAAHVQQESQADVGRGLFLGTETTKTNREQPKPRREWQYNAEKHKGKASASRVIKLLSCLHGQALIITNFVHFNRAMLHDT